MKIIIPPKAVYFYKGAQTKIGDRTKKLHIVNKSDRKGW